MAIDDSLTARVSPDCPPEIRNILLHAWGHDLSTLKTLLDERGKASAQDPKTGETPLHAAIRACGPLEPRSDDKAKDEDEGQDEGEGEDQNEVDGSEEAAREILQELFFSGAIWNDVDANNETPGCVALRLGRRGLYEMCVDAGVRAELLFALMDGYEELSSGDENEAEEMAEEEQETAEEKEAAEGEVEEQVFVAPGADEKPVTSQEYLSSTLTFDSTKLLDADLNGVMMAWETDIMRRSVAALIPDSRPQTGKRILNIGFGMGIIDSMFAALKPSVHHIVEAHPSVLSHVRGPGSSFGAEWEASGPRDGAYRILPGRWQDVLPGLLEGGEVYDAIYFDTFGEDYSQLRLFMSEYVPGLMDGEGRFGFFNGLGADRRICYDVYGKVVEMHAADAGMDVEWEVSEVDMEGLGEDGKGEWEGVRRRYWTLKEYRLPIFTFMG